MIELIYIDNGLKKGKIEEIKKLKGKRVWVDVTGMTPEDRDKVKDAFDLHPLTSDDLFKKITRIKVEEFKHYLFCVFYGVKKAKQVELVELDFVLGKNFLITNHNERVDSFEELKNNDEKLGLLLSKGPDFLFQMLLGHEVENYFPVLEEIDDEIEQIEEKITERSRPELLTRIFKAKRTIVLVKKSALPQREKISFLAKNEYSLISEKAIPYFRDVYDHSIRVADAIDNYRESISSTFEAYMSSVSNNLNEVMKVLSVIATIALPLTVISSIYGTNFVVLPGSKYPYGFWIMISFMILTVSGMMLFFKRRGWF